MFADAGYEPHLVHLSVRPEVSVYRTVARFVAGGFGRRGDPRRMGRYVPPSFLVHGVDGHPDRVYAVLRHDPRIKSWQSFDTNDLDDVRVLDQGERPEGGS